MSTSGYIFGGGYKPKQNYKANQTKGSIYVVVMALFSLGLWLLFYILGVKM